MSIRRLDAATVVFALGLVLFLATSLILEPLRANKTIVDDHLTGELAKKAIESLKPQDIQTLAEREKARLLRDPLDNSALSNLALLSQLSGDIKAAKAYSFEQTKRTMRIPVPMMIAIDDKLQSSDFPEAMRLVDGLLSSNPQFTVQIFPALMKYLDNEDVLKALAQVLVRKPSWRHEFVIWLSERDLVGNRIFNLLDSIRKFGGTVEDEDFGILISQQFMQKAYDRAYYIWLSALSSSELTKAKNLFDGEFIFEPKNLYFGWNIVPTANVESSIETVPTSSGGDEHQMRLYFVGNTQYYANVFQYLHLQPGNFSFTGQWSSSRLSSPAGLVWQLSCVDTPKLLGRSKPFSAPSAVTSFELDFSVPTSDCAYQILQVVSASAAVLDTKMDGELEFHGMNIEAIN